MKGAFKHHRNMICATYRLLTMAIHIKTQYLTEDVYAGVQIKKL